MKKCFFITAFTSLVFYSCASLTSSTVIEPKQSFVLGEGKHASYSAKIKNEGLSDVEVFKTSNNEMPASLGVLKIGQEQNYNVPDNTKVIFKNLGNSKTDLAIKLYGDKNLSMKYQNNK